MSILIEVFSLLDGVRRAMFINVLIADFLIEKKAIVDLKAVLLMRDS